MRASVGIDGIHRSTGNLAVDLPGLDAGKDVEQLWRPSAREQFRPLPAA